MTAPIDVSIIIVSYNVKDYLLGCIASIRQYATAISHEIIVVDNGSQDGSVMALEGLQPGITVVANRENAGFAGAVNAGFSLSSGDYILLLNPDTLLKDRSIDCVLEFMRSTPSAGIATCRVVDADGSPQKIVQSFPAVSRNIARALFIDRLSPENRRRYYYRDSPVRVDFVSGAFMLIRRSALPPGPLLNPDYFMYAEEKDLSLRLRKAGRRTWFVPQGEIVHFGGRSTALTPLPMFLELQKSQAKFYLNHYSVLHALALCMSWWLVLIAETAVSLPLLILAGGRTRLSLFAHAAGLFPGYALSLFTSRRRAGALPMVQP
jgi:hypothetical protein